MTQQLVPLGTGGLSLLVVQAKFDKPDGDPQLTWEITIESPGPGNFFAIGALEVAGDAVHCRTVVGASIEWESAFISEAPPVSSDIASIFADSYLVHAMYDMAATGARTAAALIGVPPAIPTLTPTCTINFSDPTDISEE